MISKSHLYENINVSTLSCNICLLMQSSFSDCENLKRTGTSRTVRLAFNHISNLLLTFCGFCANSENMWASACTYNYMNAMQIDLNTKIHADRDLCFVTALLLTSTLEYTRCFIKKDPFLFFFIIHSNNEQFAWNFYQL